MITKKLQAREIEAFLWKDERYVRVVKQAVFGWMADLETKKKAPGKKRKTLLY